MIIEPGDPDCDVHVAESFHEQTDDELTKKEAKHMEADDQAIQTILIGLPEDIYAAVDSCDTAQEIRLRVQQMMKGQDKQMQMVRSNGGNQCRHFAGQNVRQNAVQNLGIQNVGNRNRLIVVSGIANQNANQNGNGNVVAAQAEGIQLQAKKFDLIAAAGDIDAIEEVNANCILMENLQQASTSGTQTDKAFVYGLDGSTEVHKYENSNNNEIFNMFTKKEQYTKLLEDTSEPHLVKQDDNNVILVDSSMAHNGGELEQHLATLSKEKSTISYLQEERKKLKDDFKTRENELFDKLIESEKKIKELNNILVKTGQLIQTMHMLSPKPDSFYHTEQKMALGYENPHYLKQAQKKQQSLYNGKVLLDKHDPPAVYDSEKTLQLA
ncbi:hypothetical protein Tco_1172186 [Tanacetum coccineum]